MTDIEALLEPLDPDATGQDLRALPSDLTFNNIRQKREERAAEDSSSGSAKIADWRGVVAECESALRQRSKDLDIARYLTEALVRTSGLRGLANGLRLVRELLTRYWDRLHPGYEDGGIDLALRARPLSWLGSSPDFLLKVKQIPILSVESGPPRSWLDFEESRRVDQAEQMYPKAFNELRSAGRITGEEWNRLVNNLPQTNRVTLLNDLHASLNELTLLRKECEARFREEVPDLSRLGVLLEDQIEYFEERYRVPNDMGGSTTGELGSARSGDFVVLQNGAIASRDHAYNRLREIADYLRQLEPHSPVPYLIDRAISWGEMPFDALFRDVVRNSDVQKQVWETLGLGDPKGAPRST